jgi:FixJ family two-component response regulator
MSFPPPEALGQSGGSGAPAVALIEDDEDLRRALTRLLSAWGYAVCAFATAEAFLAALTPDSLPWFCLLSDVHLPGMSGLSLLRALRTVYFPSKDDNARLPVILMSGHVTLSLRRDAMAAGAVAILEKPAELDSLQAALITLRMRGREEK